MQDRTLWARIAAAPWPPGLLAHFYRTHQLTRPQVLEVAEGYRRFAYLRAISAAPLAPPPAVARLWRIHARRPDDPMLAALGPANPARQPPPPGWLRVFSAYARARALYLREFGPPPPALWPSRWVFMLRAALGGVLLLAVLVLVPVLAIQGPWAALGVAAAGALALAGHRILPEALIPKPRPAKDREALVLVEVEPGASEPWVRARADDWAAADGDGAPMAAGTATEAGVATEPPPLAPPLTFGRAPADRRLGPTTHPREGAGADPDRRPRPVVPPDRLARRPRGGRAPTPDVQRSGHVSAHRRPDARCLCPLRLSRLRDPGTGDPTGHRG